VQLAVRALVSLVLAVLALIAIVPPAGAPLWLVAPSLAFAAFLGASLLRAFAPASYRAMRVAVLLLASLALVAAVVALVALRPLPWLAWPALVAALVVIAVSFTETPPRDARHTIPQVP